MKFKVFSIYDSKAAAFLTPFFLRHEGEAQRIFGTLAVDPEHQFCLHAADFTLFQIGEFDDLTASLTELPAHVNMGNALVYKSMRQMPRQIDLEDALKVSQE